MKLKRQLEIATTLCKYFSKSELNEVNEQIVLQRNDWYLDIKVLPTVHKGGLPRFAMTSIGRHDTNYEHED